MRKIILLLFILSGLFATAQNKVVLSVRGANKVDTIYRKVGQDSIFYKINGTERAIKDSLGVTDISGKLNISDTAAMLSPYIRSAYRTPGVDSIYFVTGAGNIFAVKDSTGGGSGGVSYDTLAIRKVGIHYVGFNSGVGGNGTFGGSRLAPTNPAVDSSNIFVGRNSGGAITSGWGHIAIGAFALQAKETGSLDIAIGYEALKANNNVSETVPSVGIGYRSLLVNTGIGNVAVGTSAGAAYGGNFITAIGYEALKVATGADNTAIGYLAGGSVVGGGRNTYAGTFAGFSSTSSGNVMVGYNSGRGVTGNNNVAIGSWNSGSNLGTMQGAGNVQSVAIGSTTMNYNNGSQNTYVGANAGRGVSATAHTGAYNNGFGFQTNYDVTAAITGSSNTAIGDRITVPAITSSNQFVYGINGVNYLTRFTGGGWLVNNTTSAVTSQTTSAALEVNGTTGAILFPRLTTAQRDALTPTNGMVLYNSTTDKLQVYAAGAWVDLH